MLQHALDVQAVMSVLVEPRPPVTKAITATTKCHAKVAMQVSCVLGLQTAGLVLRGHHNRLRANQSAILAARASSTQERGKLG